VPIQHIYVKILTDEGITGIYGPIDKAQAFHIQTQLKHILIGQDPLAGEKIWDEMIRRFHRHGRTGIFMMAISAIDNGLWDLRGKYYSVPVYRLLGGPTRERIRVYASMLGCSTQADLANKHAKTAKDMGYTAQKWFFPWWTKGTPSEMMQDINLAYAVREAVGDEYELMFDAVMTWELDYALKIAKAIVPFNPKWLEEPVHACQLDGFMRIKQATGIPLAAGEHLYTRWDAKSYLDAGVLDFVQTDPDWTGGISELTKICSMSATYGVKVCPHGHTVSAAAHVIASQPESVCPFLEYLLSWAPRQQFFQKNPPVPINGYMSLPEGNGLGIELDDAKIETRMELSWD
jgi:L-alanine-DL-glutamate epimerase-like enolase superfamily enzyme